MKAIDSILVAVDPGVNARAAIAKAATLARGFGARLELFQCDAERAFALHHQYEARDAERAREAARAESRAYLERLWRSLAVPDVQVGINAACESPLYAGVVREVCRSASSLVLRAIGGVDAHREGVLSASDWELVRTCPVPLLLTRGRPWHADPAVAAAIDIVAEEAPELTHRILRAASQFATTCGARLEILHGAPLCDAARENTLRTALAACAAEAGVHVAQVHVLGGDPAAVLPAFAARRGYDLLVLGALTHRKALTALVGSLTGQLLETLDCDFLLVKPREYRSPVH